MARVYNFCAGPATLPLPVLEEAQKELLNYHGTGMSIMESSHRAKEYDKVHHEAKDLIRKLLHVPDSHEILFMTGGATTQFALIPMNFGHLGTCHYTNTGVWAQKAISEAHGTGTNIHVLTDSSLDHFNYIPEIPEVTEGTYLHITSNNTVVGTQYASLPESKIPLIADMSSDILSRPLNISQFALIYAGAQKNIGPVGVTVVIAEKDFINSGIDKIPPMFQYRTHMKHDSLYNTPPSFTIYMVGLVMKWLEGVGGVPGVEKLNREKASLLYSRIDSTDFYTGTCNPKDRSIMNVTFRLPKKELENQFVAEAEKEGLSGLKGHRSVGGIRASIYNAFPKEGVEKLIDFMDSFESRLS